MKRIVILMLLMNAGCGASLINRGSPLRIENCSSPLLYMLPAADTLAAAGAAGTAVYFDGKKKSDDKVVMATMAGTAFLISAFMGTTELALRCEDTKK